MNNHKQHERRPEGKEGAGAHQEVVTQSKVVRRSGVNKPNRRSRNKVRNNSKSFASVHTGLISYTRGFGRYAQALIMQSAAYFSMHTVEERCARWLLMTHERVGQDKFQLTHEFLGYMLGTRRPTVTLMLGTLERPA